MNIYKQIKTILPGAAAAILMLAPGCAKEVTTDTSEIAREFFEAWMKVNYPDAKPQGLGVYIIDDQPGTGAEMTDDDLYFLADYTITDLKGSVRSTTVVGTAQQVGTFSESNYYGPRFLINRWDYTETGVLEMLPGMKVGGTRTAVIPSWLYYTPQKELKTVEEYLKVNGGANAICTLTLRDKTDDIIEWEIDSLSRFVSLRMDGVDSLKFGFYMKTIKEPDDTSKYGTDSTFCINYTGRLLNGKVFDTTIEDTAKVYGIWSSSKTYAPMYVKKASDYTETTLAADETSTGEKTIDGFAYGLSQLRHNEKIVCAFYSVLGYGYSGSGTSIPSFAPLTFEIEGVDK